jgi:hypothetical protein
VRGHFEEMLLANPEQAPAWEKAWDALIEGDTGGRIAFLSKLNIPEDAQSGFIDSLADKYKNQFTKGFAVYIKERFSANEQNHAVTFGGTTDLSGLFEKHAPKVAVSQAGFFEEGKQAEEGPTSAPDENPGPTA